MLDKNLMCRKRTTPIGHDKQWYTLKKRKKLCYSAFTGKNYGGVEYLLFLNNNNNS